MSAFIETCMHRISRALAHHHAERPESGVRVRHVEGIPRRHERLRICFQHAHQKLYRGWVETHVVIKE